MPETFTLNQINRLDAAGFVETLGAIYEHSPWVAERVYSQRAFASIGALADSMAAAVKNSTHQQRLTLIRNHPQLAGKEAAEGTLTDDSTREQKGAGLDQCSAEELATLQNLNRQYLEKFEFPFVIAVKGLDRYQIIAAMQARLNNDIGTEFDTSINEICKIGGIRLRALIRE